MTSPKQAEKQAVVTKPGGVEIYDEDGSMNRLIGLYDLLAKRASEGEFHELLAVCQNFMAQKCMGNATDTDPEADHLADRVAEALNNYNPPYCYFGLSNNSDGEYGWWLDWDTIRDAEHDGTIKRMDGLPSYILEVNDHGNATLYEMTTEEVWAVV